MKPNIDNIKWIHTDGFISTQKLNYKTGTNLGDLKFEGEAKCQIINSITVIGFKLVSLVIFNNLSYLLPNAIF